MTIGRFLLACALFLGCGDELEAPPAPAQSAQQLCTGCWLGGRCYPGNTLDVCGKNGAACGACPEFPGYVRVECDVSAPGPTAACSYIGIGK